MRRTRYGAITFLAVWTAVLAVGTAVRADDPVPSQRLLPPDVVAYVTIPNVGAIVSQVEEVLEEIKADRELADIRRELEAELKRQLPELERQLGVQAEDLLNLAAGELSLAVVPMRGGKLGMVGILDYGDGGETLDALLEKAAEALKEQGAKQSREEIDDTTIIVFASPDEEEADTKTLAYFRKDSQLVVGNSVDVLRPVLARWDGEHPQTFADNEAYRYIVQRCKTEPDSQPMLTWFVNPLGLAQGVMRMAGQQEAQIQMMTVMLPRLGLDGFRGVGGSMETSVGEFSFVSRSLIYIDQPPAGLFDVLRFPTAELAPPAWVRDDVSSYFAANWDLAGAYTAIGGLVDQFMGPGTFARTVEQLADAQDGPKIHLKRDLVDHLSGRIYAVDDLPEAEEPTSQRFLLALGLTNAEKMQGTLASVAQTPGFPGTIREFRGATVYELPIPTAGGPKMAAASVSNNLLLISNDVTIIEQVIRSDADQTPLADSENYRRIARHFPSQSSLLSFEQQDSQIKALWEMLRSMKFDDEDLDDIGIDLSKLPPFQAIQRYIPLSGTYAVPDDRGVLAVMFHLKRTEDQ